MGVPLVGMLDSAGQLWSTLWRMRNGERIQVASRAISRGDPLRVAFSQSTKGGSVASDMCVFTVLHQADGVVQVPVHVMVTGARETVHCGYLPVVPDHDAQDTYALLWEALAGIGAVWARSPVRVAYVTRGRARGPLVVPITREARGPHVNAKH